MNFFIATLFFAFLFYFMTVRFYRGWCPICHDFRVPPPTGTHATHLNDCAICGFCSRVDLKK